MVLLTFADLKRRGHPYTREHTRRLVLAGKFPEPIRYSTKRIAWLESEINDFNSRLIAERDARAAAKLCGKGNAA
jgi:prophage regulatory protein